MADPVFDFVAPILRQEDGMRFHYLPVPDDIADELKELGIRRLIATINGRRVSRAIQSNHRGERFLILGQPMLRDVRAKYGDVVNVKVEPEPDPEKVDIGEEFRAVLDQDPEAAARFYAMTPGLQRSLAYYVLSAKRVETRISRSLALAHKLRTQTLYGDQHPRE